MAKDHLTNPGTSHHRESATFHVSHASGTARSVVMSGRVAWLLDRLIEAGLRGLTTAELPAGLRVGEFIRRLRCAGVPIEMSREANSGDWSGWHGRYRLGCSVTREGAK